MEQSTAIRSSKSRSSSFSKSSPVEVGGEKKLKKESTGRALRTSRVRLVSGWKKKKNVSKWNAEGTWGGRKTRTFISLLLNLNLLRQILIFLPLDRRPNRITINEFATIINFLPIYICLLQYFVLKEIVRRKLEDDLVT